MEGLRVLIAEDHEALRAMVVAFLSSEFQIVGAVGDGEQLVEAATFLKPDVVITDISMPKMDGLSAQKELWSKGNRFPFVFITMFEILGLQSHAIEPAAFVRKNDLFTELKLAIYAVAQGKSYISASFRSEP